MCPIRSSEARTYDNHERIRILIEYATLTNTLRQDVALRDSRPTHLKLYMSLISAVKDRPRHSPSAPDQQLFDSFQKAPALRNARQARKDCLEHDEP